MKRGKEVVSWTRRMEVMKAEQVVQEHDQPGNQIAKDDWYDEGGKPHKAQIPILRRLQELRVGKAIVLFLRSGRAHPEAISKNESVTAALGRLANSGHVSVDEIPLQQAGMTRPVLSSALVVQLLKALPKEPGD